MANPISKKKLWGGRILSSSVVLFLLFDCIIHILNPSFVQTAMVGLGFQSNAALIIALVELPCIFLYVYPKTSILGAILLTGYLGGAVSVNLRVGYSLFGNILFPVYIGILLWGGLYLRDQKLQELVPWRKK